MVKIFRYGYRRKGKKTWHPITVNLNRESIFNIKKMYEGIPKNYLEFYSIPKDAIFSAREIKRIR